MFSITQLHIYPVKSLGGYSVKEAQVMETGLEYDRRWMLTDENDKFLTQREHPVMALLVATVVNDELIIQHKFDASMTLRIPVIPELPLFRQVEVWSDSCEAQWVSKTADEWFGDILKTTCHLVYMPHQTKRRVDSRYAHNKELTTFTDGYPFLMISQASLDDLNNRLEETLPIDRFRPNIVFTGAAAYEEDLFEHFSIGSVEFMGVKRCGRCMITTINQQTLQAGKEPLKTLAGYRFKNNKIYFGQYLLHKGAGLIKTGDQIMLTKMRQDLAVPLG